MKRASYREAIEWLALNDDNHYLEEEADVGLSVSASLVSDLFDVGDAKVLVDLKRKIEKLKKVGKL